MTAVLAVVLLAAVASAAAWVASLVTGDTSQVDRLWSILPVAYVWVFAGFAHLASVRLNVMAVLVTLWGARLTYNFARKGGYRGVADYRWEVVRSRLTRWQFQLFNLVFITLYQNVLLVLLALPAMTAYDHRSTPFGPWDVVLTVAFGAFLAGETVADQQQWTFQQGKVAQAAAGRTPDPGFLQTGLFRFSRHPNYFFEQAQWWVVFGFGAVAAGSLLQWTAAGAVGLSALFVGSTRLTEQISASRYPQYGDYQRRTSEMVPWFPRRTAVASTSKAR